MVLFRSQTPSTLISLSESLSWSLEVGENFIRRREIINAITGAGGLGKAYAQAFVKAG